MNNYVITTDNNSDLPEEYYKELAREKLGLAGSNDIVFKKNRE